eukprot:TRINITY_DN11494_c0_g1_i1.p1 TRINITY_DN11494_c0_g1~~TRINITY_DN11494_c0_g1_i1.p1  ORF type:complete len:282 (+),score=69.84 TRINITY_DN11494_c0_g1_i1:238-1083(+)
MLLGIDIGGTKMALAFVDKASLTIQKEYRVPTGPDFTWQLAEEAIATFLSANPDLVEKLLGVGLAIPGLVDSVNIKVISTVDIPGLQGWEPKKMPQLSNLPMTMQNDGDAAGTEAFFGHGENETIITLVVGTGVGSSFLVDGRPLRGKNGWAGEIGISPIGAPGPVDYRSGGRWLLADRMNNISIEQMINLVEKKEETALNAIKESGQQFGFIIATVINIFNPGKVVVGGGTLRWPGYWEAAYEAAKNNSVEILWKECEIVVKDHLLVLRGAVRNVAMTIQ